ncbi:unnamed protein product [Pieris macdunnoughi]|uniref:Endonuclease/exonuclease/phosphatase domain-containing protein n=1 Tax=Pieris macdunnoughi TaxID=345717 RepID=A0A821W710_9NEOP|nr:unnamed protein product [Pieris macdunnoughi]
MFFVTHGQRGFLYLFSRTKLNEFCTNIQSSGADLFAITETSCNTSIYNAELVPPSYNILRCDRADGRKQGGALLVATNRFELRRVSLPGDVIIDKCTFELLCATVHKHNKYLFLCCVLYIPPDGNENEYMLLFRLLEQLCTKYKDMIVIGDFNLYSCNTHTINYYEYFVSFCELTQRNEVPNCNNRYLDLVLCSLSLGESVSVSRADEALVSIDRHHPPLVICVPQVRKQATATSVPDISQPLLSIQQNDDLWPQWNFYKADFNKLYYMLMMHDWSPIYSIGEAEDILNYFYGVMYSILDDCVPRKQRCSVNSRYNYPEWYTAEIIRNIKLKALLHKQYKISGLSSDYEMFAQCRATVKQMITSTHEKYQDNVQRNITRDPKSFWDYVRCKKGSVNHKTITKNGNNLAESECAHEFANFFKSVYSPRIAKLDWEAAVAESGVSSARVHIASFDANQVREALIKLKPKRSAGPDGIPAFIIRDCRDFLTYPLLYLYNTCFESACFPERWKLTRVIPVPKGEG